MARETEAAKKAEIARLIDPTLLARSFLEEGYVHVVGEMTGKHETYCTLRKWRGEYYHWRDGRYRHISDDTVATVLTDYLQRVQVEMRVQHGYELKITRPLLGNILLNVAPMVLIAESCELNSWLDFQERPYVIPLRNGLLGRFGIGRERELTERTPNYFTMNCLPYDYDPGAKCPLWHTFLDDIMQEDAQYINLIQEWCGYLFRPDLREQKFLLCVGEGSNGKGVFFEVVENLVGKENCSQVSLSRFDNPFGLVNTLGKVLNATNESSSLVEDESETILKSFVAGDRLTFERKFREPIHAVPTAKVMVATNSLPRFNDHTFGIWRRIILIPFNRIIVEDQQVKNLAEEITSKELPGIFNWALAGLDRLDVHGFTRPEKTDELLEEYRRDADPSRAFLSECCTFSPNAGGEEAASVYQAYREFCAANGYQPMGERNFGKQVRRVFPGVERQRRGPKTGRQYVYVGLVNTEKDTGVPCVP